MPPPPFPPAVLEIPTFCGADELAAHLTALLSSVSPPPAPPCPTSPTSSSPVPEDGAYDDDPSPTSCPVRIELNAPGSYPLGGTTPPLHLLRRLRAAHGAVAQRVAFRVMIRPPPPPPPPLEESASRSEFEVADGGQFERDMLAPLEQFVQSGLMRRGVDGFVFGLLERRRTPPLPSSATDGGDGGGAVDDSNRRRRELAVDSARCAALLGAADGYPCTFHRAFDALVDSFTVDYDGGGGASLLTPETSHHSGGGPRQKYRDAVAGALQEVTRLGFAGVLTSAGGWPGGRAVDNRPLFRTLLRAASYGSAWVRAAGQEGGEPDAEGAAAVDETEEAAASILQVGPARQRRRRRRRQFEIVAGGGVRSGNAADLVGALRFDWAQLQDGGGGEGSGPPVTFALHSSCRVAGEMEDDNDDDGFGVKEAVRIVHILRGNGL